MTTKTPSATETEAELEATLETAKAEFSELKQRADDYRRRTSDLRATILGRTIDAPEEFDTTGQPKPKTAAADLAAEIEAHVAADNFDSLLHGAEQRLKRTEEALVD